MIQLAVVCPTIESVEIVSFKHMHSGYQCEASMSVRPRGSYTELKIASAGLRRYDDCTMLGTKVTGRRCFQKVMVMMIRLSKLQRRREV